MSRRPLDQVTSIPNGTQQSPIDIVTKETIAVQWPSTYFSVGKKVPATKSRETG